MSYAGSNLRAILDLLTAEMAAHGAKVLNVIGTKADAELASFERIVWIPKSRASSAPHEQPIDGQAVKQKAVTFDVMLYAPDYESLEQLADLLEVAMYDAFSDNAATALPSPAPYKEPNAAGRGYALTMPVQLRIPVYREVWTPGVATPVTTSGTVTDPQGQNPEAIQ